VEVSVKIEQKSNYFTAALLILGNTSHNGMFFTKKFLRTTGNKALTGAKKSNGSNDISEL